MDRRTFLKSSGLFAAALLPPLDPGEPGVHRVAAEWTVEWYKRGDRIRYDVRLDPAATSYDVKDKQDVRTIASGDNAIRYNVSTGELYREKSFRYWNPSALRTNFDVEWLYQPVSIRTLAENIHYLEESGIKPAWSEERVGGVRCVKLQYDYKQDAPARSDRRWQLWLAPDMSYSLVSARRFPTLDNMNLGHGYDAIYGQSARHEGIWLLKNLEIIDNGGLKNEKLTAVFEETRVGIEIPDEVFTLENMGVPPGTPLRDRQSGKTVDFEIPPDSTDRAPKWEPFNLGNDVSTVQGLQAAISVAYKARNTLLSHSTGRVQFELEGLYD